MHQRFKCLFILLTLISSQCLAYVGIDPNAPIQITSDSGFYEQLQGQAFYQGNVIIIQGTHELKADKVSVKRDRKGSLTVITAMGNPARYTGKLASDPAPVYASAKTIYYYPDKQLVVLEGAATLVHEQDKFEGPTLNYQLDKQVISAASHKKERPTITIYPQVSKK